MSSFNYSFHVIEKIYNNSYGAMQYKCMGKFIPNRVILIWIKKSPSGCADPTGSVRGQVIEAKYSREDSRGHSGHHGTTGAKEKGQVSNPGLFLAFHLSNGFQRFLLFMNLHISISDSFLLATKNPPTPRRKWVSVSGLSSFSDYRPEGQRLG